MSTKSQFVLRKRKRARGVEQSSRNSPASAYSDNERSSSPLRLSINLARSTIKSLNSIKNSEGSPYSSQGEIRNDYESEEGSSRCSTPPLSLSVSIPNNLRQQASSPSLPNYEDYLSGDSDENVNYDDDEMMDDMSQCSSSRASHVS